MHMEERPYEKKVGRQPYGSERERSQRKSTL
jgi:hypothetical protein